MASAPEQESKIIKIVASVIIPPLGVYLHLGTCGMEVLISLILMWFFYLPGIAYALFIVFTTPGQDARTVAMAAMSQMQGAAQPPAAQPLNPGQPGAAPAEYAHLDPSGRSPFGIRNPFAPGADAALLTAVGNPGAASANPMDAGSIMPNGTHTMFESQNSGGLLTIHGNGDVTFSGQLMHHHETMVRVLRAPDGIHYRIGSVNYPHLWLQILPDGSVDGRGTVDSPYGEFELCTPAPFHFTFVGCATRFSLAAQPDGTVCRGVVGMGQSAVFKFGAPPTAGQPPYPEYVVSNRALYIAMAASLEVDIQGPEFKIDPLKVELDEHGFIKSVKGGTLEVKSMGSASASSSVAAVAMSAEEIKKHHGVHCAGFMPPAGNGKVPGV